MFLGQTSSTLSLRFLFGGKSLTIRFQHRHLFTVSTSSSPSSSSSSSSIIVGSSDGGRQKDPLIICVCVMVIFARVKYLHIHFLRLEARYTGRKCQSELALRSRVAHRVNLGSTTHFVGWFRNIWIRMAMGRRRPCGKLDMQNTLTPKGQNP